MSDEHGNKPPSIETLPVVPFPYPTDRDGWICSVCHGWNGPQTRVCLNDHLALGKCCRSVPCKHPGIGPCDMPAQKALERPMTLGRLVLETARGNVKERTITGKELDEIRANMARYWPGPLVFREPQTDSEGPVIYDAAGNQVAMLYWPCHPVEETAAAEQATYELGRTMADAANAQGK